ncbi:HalOD1 output domain-containing protein [Halomarina salina]|uniref:HalOD1 output domain-containing protein n=1 Tax=Halomarina salina TaxID=1872699 RepID=A0ABD5RJK5_9EURY|nr:HalOD1 output domain-containing protein [Halomarina salina]
MSDSTSRTGAPGEAVTVDSLVVTIVDELADSRGVEPLHLPPLYDYVDLDAIATLFDQSSPASDRLFDQVTFWVGDDEVRVQSDGTVTVTTTTTDAEPRPTGQASD